LKPTGKISIAKKLSSSSEVIPKTPRRKKKAHVENTEDSRTSYQPDQKKCKSSQPTEDFKWLSDL
jgi:hypothetical protein